MKLIFTKPHKYRNTKYYSPWMGHAIKGYLQYHGIFIGSETIDFRIEYNDLYGFYDLSLFEIPGNYGNPAKHINDAFLLFQSEGVIISDKGVTWRWVGDKQIMGKRFWIEAI